MGVFYAIKIKHKGKEYQIYDSLKIIPLPVSKISKAFKIEQVKGEIDYHKERPKGYMPTEEEKTYIIKDVEIVGKALKFFFEQDLDRMTQASNAFKDFKKMFGNKRFKRLFPILEDDSFLRKSYRGGFTYVNPKYQGVEIEKGVVFDVNSLYPSVMYKNLLPYGEPKQYEGEYEHEEIYPLFIQVLTCNFELKKGYIPTLQLKNYLNFNPLDYLESSDGLDVTLFLTSVDLELFFRAL